MSAQEFSATTGYEKQFMATKVKKARKGNRWTISGISALMLLDVSLFFFIEVLRYVTGLNCQRVSKVKYCWAPECPQISPVSASGSKSGGGLPVLFMRSLFVLLSTNSRRGLGFLVQVLIGKTTPYRGDGEDTGGLSSDPSAVCQAQWTTTEGGEGCPDHPVIHIIPCCRGTRPHFACVWAKACAHACVWRAVYTFYFSPAQVALSKIDKDRFWGASLNCCLK